MTMEEKDNIVKTVRTQQTEYDQPLLQNTYQPKEYTNQMAQKALEDAEQSAGFLSIVDQWKNKNKELQQRKQQAVQNTKMLAWGNLFTNLAKIAGMGNAPVIQNDTGVLNKAFSEVDKLRDLHYATKDAYDNAKASYKMQYAQNDRQQFQANEAARYKATQKFVDDTNEKILKGGKKTTTVEKSDPYAKAKHDREEQELSIKRQIAQSQINLNNARAESQGENKSSKDIAYIYRPDDGKEYYIDNSLAQDIEERLKSLTPGVLQMTVTEGQMYNDYYNMTHDEFGADKQKKDSPTLGQIAAHFLKRYPNAFKDIVAKAKTKTGKTSTIDNTNDDGVSFTADNSSNSSVLNFISF